MKRTLIATSLVILAAATSAHAFVRKPVPTRVWPQNIGQDVKVLASNRFEGRGPGQAGEVKTLDYLQRRFREVGLQPGPGGWLQDVPMVRYTRSAVDIGVRAKGRSWSLVVGRDVTASSHIVGRTTLKDAPLVFVGYGVQAPELGWDSFKGADLHGKVAVVLANDPDFEAEPGSPAFGKFGGKAMVYPGRFGAKVAAAFGAGAAGVLVIHEPAAASYPWRQVANGDRIPAMSLLPPGGRDPHPTGLVGWLSEEAARDLLVREGLDLDRLKREARDPAFRARPIGDAALSADLTTTADPVVSHNVVGVLPGRTRPDEAVLYGAHWDANGRGAPDASGDDIRNGAVDNATGTAELIEVARVMAAGVRPERTVVFVAYTAEEKGLLGSTWYAAHPAFPLEKTAAVINLDPHVQLGKARDVELVGPGRTDLEDDLTRAAKAENLRVDPEPHPEAGWYFRSDHYSFSVKGVPSLQFRIGRDLATGGLAKGLAEAEDYNVRRYHQPGDEVQSGWTYEGSAQEAKVALRIGLALANSRRWPQWRPGVEYDALRATSAAARSSR